MTPQALQPLSDAAARSHPQCPQHELASRVSRSPQGRAQGGNSEEVLGMGIDGGDRGGATLVAAESRMASPAASTRIREGGGGGSRRWRRAPQLERP